MSGMNNFNLCIQSERHDHISKHKDLKKVPWDILDNQESQTAFISQELDFNRLILDI